MNEDMIGGGMCLIIIGVIVVCIAVGCALGAAWGWGTLGALLIVCGALMVKSA